MSVFKRLSIVAIAAAVTLSAIVAGPSSAQAESRKIVVALAGGQNLIYAPFLVAVGSGAFERRGIEVEQQPYASGSAAFAAFAGGSTGFCICGPTHVLSAGVQGRDVVAVFNQYHGGAVVFVGPTRYEKERGADLKLYDRSTWAYTAEGSVSQAFMIRAAQAAGLDWKNQQGIAIGSVSAFVPTLQQARADIVAMDPKSAAAAMKLGIGYPVFNTNEGPRVEPIWGRQIGLPLATTRKLMQSDPKLMQDVVDAMLEGLRAVKANLDNPDAVFAMMPADFKEANKDDFALQWQLARPAFAETDGTFSEQALAETIKFSEEVGTLKETGIDSREYFKFFDNSLVVRAIAAQSGSGN